MSPKSIQNEFIVAASNSSAKDKKVAKWICDGVDDHVEIRAAVVAAGAGSHWTNEGEVLANKTFSSVWKDGATYHMYYHNGGDGGERSIGHATSTDGRAWTDLGIVLSKTGSEYGVGVPNVWKEGATWYLLFASYSVAVNTICLATSNDGTTWTRSASNPVMSPDALDTQAGLFEPTAIIKVSSTYYLYFNASRPAYGDRYTTYATSSNLTAWTKATAPLLANGRYCPGVFKCGDRYYILIAQYSRFGTGFTSAPSIAMYSATLPTFADMVFVGIVATSSGAYTNLDTPSIITSDITRTLGLTDPIMVYIAAKTSGNWGTALLYEPSVSDAIKKTATLGRGRVILAPGEYVVAPGYLYIDVPIVFDFRGAVIKSPHITGPYTLCQGCPDSELIGGTIESTRSGSNGNGIHFYSSLMRCRVRVVNAFTYIRCTDSIFDIENELGYVYLSAACRNKIKARVSGAAWGINLNLGSNYNTITLDSMRNTKAVNLATESSHNLFVDGNFDCTSTKVTSGATEIGNVYRNNAGYIAPGENRTYTGSIATLTENAFNSLDNPFGQNVALLSLDVYVATAATATSPNIDCGIGSSATADYVTLFQDLPGETIGLYNSKIATPGAQTQPILWQTGAGNRYLNMSIKDAAATGMVATYVATVMGL